jgi:hypothetical protein
MFPAAFRREGFRRSTLVMGGVLSAAVHLFLAAAVLLPLSGAPTIARANLDGAPPVLTTLDDPTAPTVPVPTPAVPQANTRILDDAPLAAAPVPQAPVRRPRPPPPPPPPPTPTPGGRPARPRPPAGPPPPGQRGCRPPRGAPATTTRGPRGRPHRGPPRGAGGGG